MPISLFSQELPILVIVNWCLIAIQEVSIRTEDDVDSPFAMMALLSCDLYDICSD